MTPATNQVHFVATSVNGVAVPPSQQHWRDTFNLPPQIHNADGTTSPSVTTVLIDFRDPVIRGTFLFHCHIIDHEDAGMMAKIQVM
jgi:FtsP/CotA-like multicopper oxidase with cupredoxin domain